MTVLKKWSFFFVFLFSMLLSVVAKKEISYAKPSSFITESKFKGEYDAFGKYIKIGPYLKIESIQNGRVKGVLDNSTLSVILNTEFTTSKIKGNQANFQFVDNWDNKGKGTLTFHKNGSLTLSVKTVKRAPVTRGEFDLKDVPFSKQGRLYKTKVRKLKDGNYLVKHFNPKDDYYLDATDMTVFSQCFCERARIKKGKLTLWGSFYKVKGFRDVLDVEEYARREFKLSKHCKMTYWLPGGDTQIKHGDMTKEEFNKWFDTDKGGNYEFSFIMKKNQVVEIEMTAIRE